MLSFVFGVNVRILELTRAEQNYNSFNMSGSRSPYKLLLGWLDGYFVIQKLYAHLSGNDVSLYTYTSFTAQWCLIANKAPSHLQLAM